jgi:starvation-inducible DNA-binding protein
MRLPNMGLTDRQRISAIADLNVMLSNIYVLQVKTKKAHWDVVGPQFKSLHALFAEHYKQLDQASDEIAERVRMLGGYPIGTVRGFLELASIEEHPGEVRKATEAVQQLLEDHELMAREVTRVIQRWSSIEPATADTLTGHLKAHQKMAWELRSLLEGEPVQPDGAVDLPAPLTPTMA